MISAGNDIIDLNAINTHRTQQYNFYSKILSANEQDLYSLVHSIPFIQYVWMLWSIKESAYKFFKRHDAGLVFSPTKIVVQPGSDPETSTIAFNGQMEGQGFDSSFYKGTVSYDDAVLYYHTLIEKEFIATMVNHQVHCSQVYWGVKAIDKDDPDSQSVEVRRFVKERLRTVFHADDIMIEKNPTGYPQIVINEEMRDIPLSFSHHKRFIAYSFYR